MEYKLEQFEGPLHLLLELIESEKLDISQISLLKITDQFIDYIEKQKAFNTDELADFLVIATKLLLLKSKILLPNLNLIEEEKVNLEEQLKIYREYFEAAKKIEQIIQQKNFAFTREKVFSVQGFFPPKHLSLKILQSTFLHALRGIEIMIKLPQKTLRRIISLQDKINHIQNLLRKKTALKFKELLSHSPNSADLIITFLAILELMKRKNVAVNQEDLFGEIEIINHSD